ncbi:hypothetical protein Lepto7375DRAFT_7822 [Leptolyngbya sp. PCC 7375]|nr:hypothetical protein Lepto7375DRAFT_7822 [Leptolyngbya sp. PCC 7375]
MAAKSAQTRELLTRHGDCEKQDLAEWSGPFELPNALRDFYSDVGPKDICIEGYGNPTTIPSLKRLWDRQAGYRWNGLTNEPIEEWPSNWIVVADEGADPYIFDTETGRILFAQHGAGAWDAGEIYPDITTMAACIATLGCVILDSQDFEDEDCNINPNCRMDAIDRLTEILGNQSQAEAIVEMAGWG